jgi:uncharacterized membrane protein
MSLPAVRCVGTTVLFSEAAPEEVLITAVPALVVVAVSIYMHVRLPRQPKWELFQRLLAASEPHEAGVT